jgi:hypothetical protein
MLTLLGRKIRFCDGIGRRDFLRIGTLGVAGVTLADLLRLRAAAGQGATSAPRGVIMICLPSGPSHIDMYDMKPDSPVEYRCEFRPIQTNVPGFDVCEHMPMQTKIADTLAVVRNLTFTQPDHQLHEVYTGFPGAPKAPFMSPPVRPAFGSIVSKLRGEARSVLPSYVSMGLSDHSTTVGTSEVPLYLGSAHAPFEPAGQGLRSLHLRQGMTRERLGERRTLVGAFDQLRRDLDASGQIAAVDQYTGQALDMITSPGVREAFDLEKELARVRALYGPDLRFHWEYQAGHTWHASRFLLPAGCSRQACRW